MTQSQKIFRLILIILAVFYFALFLFPNLAGARDEAMLSAFEHDEFAQYSHVIHMLENGENFKAAVHNFLVYSHYYYGYPFYFFSALFLLPIKFILGADWTSQTRIIVAILRQMINALPFLLSALFLIWDQLKSKNPLKAILSFLLMASLPAVIDNNLWWHPDSLLVLFSVLTILFLIRDDGKFGLFFYLSGLTCALAIGSKILGVLFVVTYAAYLVYGLVTRRATWKKALLSAVLFLIVLFGSVILTNPLLLLPLERSEIINTFKANFSQSTQGFWVTGNDSDGKWVQLRTIFEEYYGGTLLVFFSLLAVVWGLIKKPNKLKYLVILTWTLGYMGYFIFFASTIRPHYFIPVILPLYAVLVDELFDFLSLKLSKEKSGNNRVKRFVSWLMVIYIILTIGLNTVNAGKTWQTALHREETSASIGMFKEFQDQLLPELPDGTPLLIYRDWRAYVGENPHWRVIYNWDLATYDYLAENQPDLLFIEKDNVLYFSDDAKLETALNPDQMIQMNQFYGDVLEESVTGYHQLYKDGFGYIFASDNLYVKYFKN